jgi:hypothetical protein
MIRKVISEVHNKPHIYYHISHISHISYISKLIYPNSSPSFPSSSLQLTYLFYLLPHPSPLP